MKKRLMSRVLSAGLAVTATVMMAGCAKTPAPEESAETAASEETAEEPQEEEAEAEDTTEEPAAESADSTAVYATATLGQKFGPFFATTAYDVEIQELTSGFLLATDRGGAIVENGIEGETRTYNGTDYTYRGLGNVEVVQNDDGTVDYKLTMRDDVKFSDGEPATIDDVIFSIYVLCDPTYDGSSTIYALPIKGMEEFRGGMDSRGNVIFAAGEDGYKENDNYTQEQYDAFWDYYNNEAGAAFAQEIVDYCIANGYNAEGDSVSACAANWGFELAEDATAQDFWDAIVAAYDTVEEAEETESAGSNRLQLTIAALGADYEKGVSTGESAANIEGIEKTGDYSLTVHMTQYDAKAIYDMAFPIAPLHYYGDPSLYDYDNNKFGFEKGDLSKMKSLDTQPLGCGPYTFEGYKNGVVTLVANPYYFEGEPKVKNLLFQEAVDADYVPGITTGTFDIAVPSMNDETVKAIKDANGNDDLVGDSITTYLVDYRGYGYLGINADLVNVGGEPGSDASKALRKGFMTLLSVHRDTVINSYYGDRASVIQYPISNTSWAAPKPADEGYKTAYSVDVDGNPIYDDSMNEEARYEAAKQAAIGYFKAAGYTFDDATGKFTDFDTVYEVIIPGSGTQDHPAYGIVEAAASDLESMGIKLQLSDVGTSEWNNALEGNTAQMWAAAWQATVDPDMTQVYHSMNAHGEGTNSNHYAVDDPELDELIVEGKSSADTEYRKSVYKNAMEIIMDWGCELPLYQRKDCTTVSTERIDVDTMPKDMTPYWGWKAEIDTLATR
ncbi:ABC transporter substrate-binding protein [Butyrivibrio sp. MC2013]|uniref:ABC transporter substrate-binding protein n=1 Tax=Butyrivibrio sp. MC2013 TaxID=1280686 RepID=UPI0003FE3E3F|nr:ABC transporter substrate-binding protein [Butyrivibrio sp. MC2013]